MSPKFDVHMEIYKKEGVLDPVANTLNNVRGNLLSQMFGEAAAGISVEFQQVGRSVRFVVDCETLSDAESQAQAMKELPVISNPVIEDVQLTVAPHTET